MKLRLLVFVINVFKAIIIDALRLRMLGQHIFNTEFAIQGEYFLNITKDKKAQSPLFDYASHGASKILVCFIKNLNLNIFKSYLFIKIISLFVKHFDK